MKSTSTENGQTRQLDKLLETPSSNGSLINTEALKKTQKLLADAQNELTAAMLKHSQEMARGVMEQNHTTQQMDKMLWMAKDLMSQHERLTNVGDGDTSMSFRIEVEEEY